VEPAESGRAVLKALVQSSFHTHTTMSEHPSAPPSPSLGPPDDPGGDSESTFHLIDRARAGDRDAVERLFARHLAPLRRWASGRLPHWARDLADTEDLVQDALLQTFRRIDVFEVRGSGALQAYLRQAIVNRVRDELRKRACRPERTALDSAELEAILSPLELAIGREEVENYHQALLRLTQEDREAIVGRIEMGYSYGELAQVLGRPSPEAARKAAQRAVVRLVEVMQRGATS
jgi:RNA polymerase sigma-70 factor (ECF subfamily)